MSIADRADPTLTWSPPGFPKGYRVTCCKCGYWTDISIGNVAGGIPPDWVARKVRQRGWEIPKKFDSAICPKCVEAKAQARKKPKLVPVEAKPHTVPPDVETLLSQWEDNPDLAPAAQDNDPMPETATVTQLRADQPRTMTRSDRQVIFTRLQDAYPKEDAGYAAGWSDDKVAKDLGVPKGWVALLRDENFGPATVGPSVEEQFAAYRAETEEKLVHISQRLGTAMLALKEATTLMSSLSIAKEKPL